MGVPHKHRTESCALILRCCADRVGQQWRVCSLSFSPAGHKLTFDKPHTSCTAMFSAFPERVHPITLNMKSDFL